MLQNENKPQSDEGKDGAKHKVPKTGDRKEEARPLEKKEAAAPDDPSLGPVIPRSP